MTTASIEYQPPGDRPTAARAWRPSLSARHIPILATAAVWLVLLAVAAVRYDGFLTAQVLVNLVSDNAFLGIAAIGMTFVILSGGIDLSVGAMVGFTSILIASLMTRHGWPAPMAISAALLIGLIVGASMGGVIAFFALPPFLVTLAGMFLMRGLALVISLQTVTIEGPFFKAIGDFSFRHRYLPVPMLIFLCLLVVGIFIAHQTRFGRAVYAIGGSESSALLMGVPVAWTKVRIYAFSGLCSALAGVVYSLYTSSGNANAAAMLELDAIAAVVIGGTPLAGGIGYVLGTLLGVLILGTIQTIIIFEGTLSAWWGKIAVGVLLLGFILLQMVVQARVGRRKPAPAALPAGAAKPT